MPLWAIGLILLAVVVVVTAPQWVTMLESLTGSEDDYQSRIDKRKR